MQTASTTAGKGTLPSIIHKTKDSQYRSGWESTGRQSNFFKAVVTEPSKPQSDLKTNTKAAEDAKISTAPSLTHFESTANTTGSLFVMQGGDGSFNQSSGKTILEKENPSDG